MWSRRSHTLVPLTRLTSIKSKCKWTQVEQDAFDGNNRIMSHNFLLTYSDFNETIKIHTDASAFQLRAVVNQKGKMIAFYSRKLADSQQLYTVTYRELLSII